MYEALSAEETYRVAILESLVSTEPSVQQESRKPSYREAASHSPSGPPVEEGEVRDVTIETVGDQGDDIAKVERGYVVIVAGAYRGDEPTVEIEQEYCYKSTTVISLHLGKLEDIFMTAVRL